MSRKKEKDEHLEQLWYMKEDGNNSADVLISSMGVHYDDRIFHELVSEEMVALSKDKNKVKLTKKGHDYTQQLIRAHRLAERLLYNVLGGDFESGACEFEHIVTPQLVDSICILLGHPKTCPHGMAIPEGQCCQQSQRTAQSSVMGVVELEIGQSARVAYINCKSDQQLHKIDNLRIRPGAVVTLHQKYPSYVIECQGSNIAMDEEIASNICVWRESDCAHTAEKDTPGRPGRKRRGWSRFRYRRGNRS